MLAMNIANYSLITIRPDLERIDVLCVGAAITTNGEWDFRVLPTVEKILPVSPTFSHDRLSAIGVNLKKIADSCTSVSDLRRKLQIFRSGVAIHEFEGEFSYDSKSQYDRHVEAIMHESVFHPSKNDTSHATVLQRPRIRTRLKRQFAQMGILGKPSDDIGNHKVIPNFPVSLKHGLKVEFAIKNGVMNLTETVDFEAGGTPRQKIFEAQAKCLILRTAQDSFANSKCHVVISGGRDPRSSRSIDLLSTVAELYALESSSDMASYFDRIAQAAGSTQQLGRRN